jgi:hypothetical protein
MHTAYNMKNIPVSNKLSKVIIAKDLTIQQRDQNKKSLKAILISGSCIFISVHTSFISEWSYSFRAMLYMAVQNQYR